MLRIILLGLIFFGATKQVSAQSRFEKDLFKTKEDNLEITFLGHGTLMLSYQDKTIHVDPFGEIADYNQLPKADIILLTHEHFDHMDLQAIDTIKKEDTSIVLTEICAEKISGGTIMRNNDINVVKGLEIEAVPAYNIKHERSAGNPFHPKGNGNGYIINFAGLRVYIAADTENIPEMKDLGNVDIAFLPMNLPYTMTPEMVADAAKMIKPKILYPYHFGDTDTKKIIDLLKQEKNIEVRIRKLS